MQDLIFEVIEKAIRDNLFNIVKVNAINDVNYVMYKRDENTRINNIMFKNKTEVIEEIFYILDKNYRGDLITAGYNPESCYNKLINKIKYYIITKVTRVDEICTDLKYKDIIFEKDNKKYINLFRTTNILEKKVETEETDFENIKKIILNLCGNEQANYEYFMKWLALMIQKPSIRTTNGIIFTGYYGSGKGEFTDILKIMMKDTMQIVQADMFKQKWNDFLEGKILIIGNEIAYVSNDERYYVANKLKSIISDIDIQIEGKFEPIRNSKNYARVIVFSNDRSPIVIQNGDRRYFVIASKTTLLNNEDYNTTGLYTVEEYNNWKNSEKYNKEVLAFSKYLQEMEVSENVAYMSPPITYEKKQIINMSETNFKNYIFKILSNLIINNKTIIKEIDNKKEILMNFKEVYQLFLIDEELKKSKYANMVESQFKAYLFIHCDIRCVNYDRIMYLNINKNVFKQLNENILEISNIKFEGGEGI